MHISENLEKNISQIIFGKISLEIGFRKITNSLLQTFFEFLNISINATNVWSQVTTSKTFEFHT